eukprot:CAMPEP_0179037254 /NCGR_PEP_ID=MMETSP0796-20121207/14034_1 /TAXON_ID=73915 /ORGANISM="Pyrodinium bahamense, Strain pbaha01" /LENGTH=42 /DNA_ID= /DNA_START= /DNA_END= /DNA_ORIENTATION=
MALGHAGLREHSGQVGLVVGPDLAVVHRRLRLALCHVAARDL